MALEVEVRERLDEITVIEPDWVALHERSGARLPFSAPEWGLTWLQHFAASGPDSPLLLEVREAGELVGVAACYRHRMRGGLSRVQPAGAGVEWIGPFEVPSLLAAPGRGRDVARVVVDRLCRLEPAWDWANVALGEGAPWLEPEWLPDPGFTSMVRHVVGAVVVDLRVERPEDVLSGHRNLKESLRRARNRLTKEFGADGWQVRRHTQTSEVDAAFGRLARLHAERAEAQGHREAHRNVFASPRALAYVADVVHRLARRDRVCVYEVEAGGEVIAAQLVLRTATASYTSVSGVSDAGWRFSSVTHLLWTALADAHALGHVEINLSIGPNQAKLRWSPEVRHYPDHVVLGPRRRSRTAYLAAQTAAAVRSYREAVQAHGRPSGDAPAKAGSAAQA